MDILALSGRGFDRLETAFVEELNKVAAKLHNPDLEILSYKPADLTPFVKLLVTFILFREEAEFVTPLVRKMDMWYTESQPILKELRLTAPAKKCYDFIHKNLPGIDSARKVNAFKAMLSDFRIAIFKNKTVKDKLFNTSAMGNQMKGLLNNCFGIINSNSVSGYNGLARNISLLHEPLLNAYFVQDGGNEDTSEVVKNYLKFIKDYTGKNDQYIHYKRVQKLKASNPTMFAVWQDIAKKESTLFKNAVISILRNSGKETISAEKLKKELKSRGLLTWRIPEGFDGLYNEKMEMFLKDGTQLSNNGKTGITQIGGWMRMFPDADPSKKQKVAEGQGVNVDSKNTYGTMQGRSKSARHRFDLVKEVIPHISTLAQNWRHDFLYANNPKTKMLGAMAETIYLTAARIGSPGNKTDGKETYGISTIKCRDVKKVGNALEITYAGKKGVKITNKIKPVNEVSKRLIAYILELKAAGSPNSPLWEIDGEPFSQKEFREYLRSEEVGMPKDLGPHKFRHIKGTILFTKLMEANPPKKNMTPTAFQAHMKAVLTEVGAQLGHMRTDKEGKQQATYSTVVTNYIDPQIVIDEFMKYDQPIPGWLKNIPEE